MKEAISPAQSATWAPLDRCHETGCNFTNLHYQRSANSTSITAASFEWPKVTQDELMKEYDQQYPGYDFTANAGYGTAKHLEGLEKQVSPQFTRPVWTSQKHWFQLRKTSKRKWLWRNSPERICLCLKHHIIPSWTNHCSDARRQDVVGSFRFLIERASTCYKDSIKIKRT